MSELSSIQGKLKKILKLAKSVASCSDFEPFKLGAVIFDKHKVYAVASNSEKSYPLQRKYNKAKSHDYETWSKHSVHAEINCIHKFIQQNYGNMPDISTLSILVYREHTDGSFALAKPCKACSAAIRDFGFKHVYYTGEHSLIYEELI